MAPIRLWLINAVQVNENVMSPSKWTSPWKKALSLYMKLASGRAFERLESYSNKKTKPH